ncbi:hypothetical protein I5M32_15285 [Pedobacter sp. SD-b]|uniref:DUF5808 domain-containing protein n=1 Tax=Pedobacter segetis TaxID=2793069 RepID=A0ABS1BN61_9SPHI|nr:hypothetical protein [Pedobacter segetis]MBK0384330.1 hypothetical protein [Pedobacter segetis]
MVNPPKKDLSKYKGGVFFFDANDEDLIVPMANPRFGYTLNFAKPLAYIFLLIVLLVFILITRLFA